MKKSKQDAKGPSGLMKLALLLVVSYVVFTLLQLQIDIRAKKEELDEISQQCIEQTLENQELESYLSMGDNTQLIEKIAREKLGYAYPGEQIFYDSAGN